MNKLLARIVWLITLITTYVSVELIVLGVIFVILILALIVSVSVTDPTLEKETLKRLKKYNLKTLGQQI